MKEFVDFALLVILISASGVMAPGPLFAANISLGLKKIRYSGIKVAVGHSVIELPLIIFLGIGIFSIEFIPEITTIISILGAITLFFFGIFQIVTTFRDSKNIQKESKQNPIITGIVLSGLNPFFIIWWVTIGLKLISDSMMIWGFIGLIILFLIHVWMDFVWLGITGIIAKKSSDFISKKIFKIIMTSLSGVMIFYGIKFLIDVQNF
jgi:threonine/homoserine/homoserine lactone efflux protein